MKKSGIVLCHIHDILLKQDPINKNELLVNWSRVLNICADKNIPVINLNYKTSLPICSAIRDPLNRISNILNSDTWFGEKESQYMKSRDINSVGIIGLFADACVYTNAEFIYKRGFEVFSSENLVDNRVSWGRNQLRRKFGGYYDSFVYGPFFDKIEEMIGYISPS